MPYTLGQYYKPKGTDDDIYMNCLTADLPEVSRRDSYIVSPLVDINQFVFKDECLIRRESKFSNKESYYFHGKIKKRLAEQRFYIKLANDGDLDQVTQFITEKIIPGGHSETEGDPEGWYDIEFTFTPFMSFDTLWFQLIREVEDYKDGARYPKIIYEEISVMNNLFTKKSDFSNMDTGLIKMGIQGRPHMWMFVNQEDVRTDRSGIYEVRNGNVLVNSFSVIGMTKFTDESTVSTVMYNIDKAINDKYEQYMTDPEIIEKHPIESERKKYCSEQAWKDVNSVSLLDNLSRTRAINSFTMDYMYRDKE